MEIRRITEYDAALLDAVRSLLGQLSPTADYLTEARFRRLIAAPSAHLLMLFDDGGRPVGMLTVGVYPTPGGVKAWIEDVAVDRACRGRGYGRAIVSHAIDYARMLGADTLGLTSNPARIAANGLYRSLGFEPYTTNVYRMKL